MTYLSVFYKENFEIILFPSAITHVAHFQNLKFVKNKIM